MDEKEISMCEYHNLLDILTEMVATYLTKQPKEEEANA